MMNCQMITLEADASIALCIHGETVTLRCSVESGRKPESKLMKWLNKTVDTIREKWDDEESWMRFGDLAAAYGVCGMISFVAGLILAALII